MKEEEKSDDGSYCTVTDESEEEKDAPTRLTTCFYYSNFDVGLTEWYKVWENYDLLRKGIYHELDTQFWQTVESTTQSTSTYTDPRLGSPAYQEFLKQATDDVINQDKQPQSTLGSITASIFQKFKKIKRAQQKQPKYVKAPVVFEAIMEFLVRRAIPKEQQGQGGGYPIDGPLSDDQEDQFIGDFLLYISETDCGFQVIPEESYKFRSAIRSAAIVCREHYKRSESRKKLNENFDSQNIISIKESIQRSLKGGPHKPSYVPQKSLFKTRVIEPLFTATEKISKYFQARIAQPYEYMRSTLKPERKREMPKDKPEKPDPVKELEQDFIDKLNLNQPQFKLGVTPIEDEDTMPSSVPTDEAGNRIFEDGMTHQQYVRKVYKGARYELSKVKAKVQRLSSKAQKFFADIVEMLRYPPKFQVVTKHIMAECVEVYLDKQECDKFHEALKLGHSLEEVDGLIAVRFLKPKRKFYNSIILAWFSIKPSSLDSLDSSRFVQLCHDFYEKNKWVWKKKFEKPMEAFFKIMQHEWRELLSKVTKYDQIAVPVLLDRVKRALYVKWREDVFSTAASFKQSTIEFQKRQQPEMFQND